MLKNYANVFKKSLDFSSRAKRKEFWLFFLANLLFTSLLTILEALLGLGISFFSGTNKLPMLYLIIIFLPSLAVLVRRLHDLGVSGLIILFHQALVWLAVILVDTFPSFEPYFGSIYMVLIFLLPAVCLSIPGSPAANKYDQPSEIHPNLKNNEQPVFRNTGAPETRLANSESESSIVISKTTEIPTGENVVDAASIGEVQGTDEPSESTAQDIATEDSAPSSLPHETSIKVSPSITDTKKRFCKRCGSEVDRSTGVCSGCGKKIIGTNAIKKTCIATLSLALAVGIIGGSGYLAYSHGFNQGYQSGYENGNSKGLSSGYSIGHLEGYQKGWGEGRAFGVKMALIYQGFGAGEK